MALSPIEWRALEHQHEEKNPDWYWAVGIVAISVAVTAIILNNILFAVVILIGAASMAMHSTRKPRIFDVRIDDRGIQIDRMRYQYESLVSFWINQDEEPPTLLVKIDRTFIPLLVIHLTDVPIEEVRNILRENLYETKLEEPLLQKIFEYLGF